MNSDPLGVSQSASEPAAATAPPAAITAPAARGEIVLRLQDAAYTNSEQALRMLPRTGLVWDDVRILLGVATRLLGPHPAAALNAIVLDCLLASTPTELVAIVTGDDCVAKNRSAESPAELSGAARALAERASAAKAGILAFGDSTAICAPLVYQDNVLGVLVLESSNAAARLDKRHLQLVIGIAVLAAPALAARPAEVQPEAGPAKPPAKRPRRTKSE